MSGNTPFLLGSDNMKRERREWVSALQTERSDGLDRSDGSDRSDRSKAGRWWRCIWGIAALALFVVGFASESAGQPVPDLTVSQTQGVNENEFFFLGPTGMRGWMWWSSLTRDARQILVTHVPSGSPGDLAGIQRHDVILGIGSENFTYDARAAFVHALADAEGGDGQLHLKIYRPSTEETLTKTVQLGISNAPLAETTPYDCPYALAVLTNYCEYVYANGPIGHPTPELSVWAMLGSGIEKYEDWAVNWVQNSAFYGRTDLSIYRPLSTRNWALSSILATLSQYYLFMKEHREEDTSVLASIENLAQYIADGQDHRGQWGHIYAFPVNNGGQLHGTLPGYGAVNAAGLISFYGLALAQRCGITNNPSINAAVEKSAEFFRAHVGIGSINYGFNPPIPSVTDSNGRMGLAALAFRALGDVETAKWFTMMTSTYGLRDWGHTGNEFNHAWGPLAASVGGPELVNFVQTAYRENLGDEVPYFQVSLHMRRQPDGRFQSQGQSGRGAGRSNGHATGAYAVQLATPAGTIDATGQGYDTNLFWLTEQEMEYVRIGYKYESSGSSVNHLDTEVLFDYLSLFAPRVVNKVADELGKRLSEDYAGGTVEDALIAIVEDAEALDTKRVAALRALDEGGKASTVRSTTDTWYAPPPANTYVLNYGARRHGSVTHTSRIKILEAIAEFDRSRPFEMLLVGDYSQRIYQMSTNGFTEAEMEIYYDAVEMILSPEAGSVNWFLGNQDIANWSPHLLARYADSLLEVAETFAMSYNAGSIIGQPPFGEGMYSWMVRSGHTPPTRQLDTSGHWRNYGENALIYTNFMRRLKSQAFPYEHHFAIDAMLDMHLPARGTPEILWFRDVIAENHDDITDLQELRDLMDDPGNAGKHLMRAVILHKIANHDDNEDPFEDIVKYVGFRSPIVRTAWRLYRGAIELGAVHGSDQDWLDALEHHDTPENHPQIAGIMHVLAAREVAAAKALAEPYLLHENDFVTIGALDVYRAVGDESDLVMLFNQFMTNASIIMEGEVTFVDDFKIHAYWDAIHAIVERHQPISETTANQIAAAFNAQTDDGNDMTGIAIVGLPLAEPMSVLNPPEGNVDKVYGRHMTGPIGILGLFPGTDCDQALLNVVNNVSDVPWWGREHKYAASEAFLRQLPYSEVIAIHNAGSDPRWNPRAVTMYLMMEFLQGNVPFGDHLDLLTVRGQSGSASMQRRSDGGNFWRTYQYEMNRRRGLEEQDGVHFFYVK